MAPESPEYPQSSASFESNIEIEMTDFDGNSFIIPVTSDELIIGRSGETHIQLKWGTVSRQHAKLVREDDENWTIIDMSSREGVAVNGQKVQEQATVKPGDVITISFFRLKLQEVGGGD